MLTKAQLIHIALMLLGLEGSQVLTSKRIIVRIILLLLIVICIAFTVYFFWLAWHAD
jgi:hypothetical protein